MKIIAFFLVFSVGSVDLRAGKHFLPFAVYVNIMLKLFMVSLHPGLMGTEKKKTAPMKKILEVN